MATKQPQTRAGATPRRRRKPAGAAAGLTPTNVQGGVPPHDIAELQRLIQQDGGATLSVYREPYAGRWLILAALPLQLIAPTPYQRNLSETHVRRLEQVISKLGRFLDPVVVVRAQGAQDGSRYWTPNGHHRLSAMRTLGAKSIIAIVMPEPAVAYQILALNTEKAHNLREKALEVIRMYRELARLDETPESSYALEFEEPALVTLGLCYEQRPRFSGGAYHPVLKRVEEFLRMPCREGLRLREERAGALLALDEVVIQKVEALKSRGLTGPYLKNFVVARLNPLCFRPKEAPTLSFDDAMERMMKAVQKFDAQKIKSEDLAKAGGVVEESD